MIAELTLASFVTVFAALMGYLAGQEDGGRSAPKVNFRSSSTAEVFWTPEQARYHCRCCGQWWVQRDFDAGFFDWWCQTHGLCSGGVTEL